MQPPFCLSQCVKNLHTTIFFTANAHTNVELKELAQGNSAATYHGESTFTKLHSDAAEKRVLFVLCGKMCAKVKF